MALMSYIPAAYQEYFKTLSRGKQHEERDTEDLEMDSVG
jgi:hypothetical protein